MQRPSTRLINEFGIIEQFKNHCIEAVFNFEEPGEHPYCGDGILKSSGFSYDPETDLFPHGVGFYNFGWEDHSITSLETLLRICHVMHSYLKQRKRIAVHCHAGRGRTAIGICGYLILYGKKTAEETIAMFQSKREGSLKKQKQKDMIKAFEEYIKKLRSIFNSPGRQSLEEALANQRKVLDGEERVTIGNLPVELHHLEDRLLTLLDTHVLSDKEVLYGFIDPSNREVYASEWGSAQEEQLLSLKADLDEHRFQFSKYTDVRVLCQCYLDFFEALSYAVLTPELVRQISESKIDSPITLKENIKKKAFLDKFSKGQLTIIGKIVILCSTLFKLSNPRDERGLNLLLHRMAIALTRSRSRTDDLFYGRTIIKDEFSHPDLIIAKKLLVDWVNAEPIRLLEDIEILNSPLNIPSVRVLNSMSKGKFASLFARANQSQ
eukprot:TRINITY_DN8655_c0_g1_i1.p1 TRINITY_DN8655_c0_g1~~TRINITY_DN8655_c0_g1_i1.p1  ORF type:complete len:436 (+),score=90.54 TRINITY_DN8655_c0_g1_i1:242-1549(+)